MSLSYHLDVLHSFIYPQGVQAQTVANFYLAFESELSIIPALNKIDLKGAKPDEVSQQLQSLFDFDQEDILKVIKSIHATKLVENSSNDMNIYWL
jgi:translation elongation factor EF-4